MPIDEVRKLINAVDNHKTEFNSSLAISKELRKLLNIPEPSKSMNELQQKIENMNKKTENLENMNKQQTEQTEVMQKLLTMNKKQEESIEDLKQQIELLTNFIKSSNIRYDIRVKNDDIKNEKDNKIDD